MTHISTTATTNTPLRAAAEQALRSHWAGLRTYKRSRCQLGITLGYLESLGCSTVDSITPDHLMRLREWTYNNGSGPATVNIRLACLSVLGVKVTYCKPPRHRKWFLSPQEEERLYALALPNILRAFVSWTVSTGLRVEESLSLRWRDVDLTAYTVSVAGTKTDLSQATLPLSEEALDALAMVLSTACRPGDPIFAITYQTLRRLWEIAREALGLADIPTATLKSLRRSFARRAHLKGMPADVLRQYLRHGNIKTTMGYLWLVGGYSQDEMRKYL